MSDNVATAAAPAPGDGDEPGKGRRGALCRCESVVRITTVHRDPVKCDEMHAAVERCVLAIAERMGASTSTGAVKRNGMVGHGKEGTSDER